MEENEVRDILSKESPQINQSPADTIPTSEKVDVSLNEEHLGGYLVNLLKNDMIDKADAGYNEKRAYDLKAYYGIKDEALSNWPWPRSSNFPVPITPVMVDTGHSATMDSLKSGLPKIVSVTGIGKEDVKNAKKLESLYNWQLGVDIENFMNEMDGNIFQSFLHGTSYFKLARQSVDGKTVITPVTVPIERVFLPIDASGPSANESDHVIQLIPLTAIDLLQRKAMGVYRNLDSIGKGMSFAGNTSEDELNNIRTQFSGLDLSKKINRDIYFIAEAYVTYAPKDSLRAVELIVWFAPSTGKILRVMPNDDKVRPYADYKVYPINGMAFGRSLPEKIRHIQEKADYTDKQVTDAADKAISPGGFYDEGTTFNAGMNLRVPGGMYPMQNANSINWEPINITAIMERTRAVEGLWLQSERVTGFTDLFQGVADKFSDTVRGDMMRMQRSTVRFGTIYGRLNNGLKKTLNILHYYNDKFLPRNTVIRVLGSDEFSSINQLFPVPQGETSSYGLNVTGKFDFNFAGKPITEQEAENRSKSMISDSVLIDPVFGQDKGTRWKALELKSEANGFNGFESLVPKPTEAYILSPEEIIMAFMSGEKDVQPSIEINPMEYINRIKIFSTTENFKAASDAVKQEFQKFVMKVEAIRVGQLKARHDDFLLKNPPPIMNGIPTDAGSGESVTPQNPEITPENVGALPNGQ